MNTQSFRFALGVAFGAMALAAGAEAADRIGEHFAADAGRATATEHRARAMDEIIVVGRRLTPPVDMERLEAELRKQALALTEQLNAAIERELKELAAPKLEIQVAGI